ncbi:hypothetical protein [Polynucleobacter asymbioticus]|uniref:hypothetical protein n=1 Tax=Polynucleobacter asymbioticus TaxID=576611 RepID=UPI0008F843A3|nr:hypothetical protein [Polynucleobacter asymbioticus]
MYIGRNFSSYCNFIAKPIIGSAADQLKNKFNEYRDVAVNGPKPIQEPVLGFADNPELIKPREPIVQVEAAPAEFNNTQPLSVIKAQPENRAQTNPFTPSEIDERRALLNKIGLEDHRQSALEGNPKESASQFITSQADQGPYASGMTEQINKEKSVLDNHFDKIAKESGGTQVRYNDPVFQESDKIKAGTTIKDALQESYDQHKAQTADLYKEATQKLGNRPVSLDNFNNFINADENFAYQNEKGLQSGIKQFMNRSGYLDEAGNVKPLTVAQAEDVRQYINSKYHHETKQLGGQLKGLIDNDVFETVGGETYEKARNHYITGNDVYNNPKAMGDLLGDNGVNEKIPDEKVLPKISALPNKQFEHLFNTLNDNGKTNATNQIKTALVEQIKQAGSSAKNQPFNSVAASNEAAKLSQKLRVAFADDPQALQSIYDGIKAADILHIPTKYPGAAVQDNLLKNKFSEAAIQRAGEVIGAGAGGWLGGTPGGALGGAAGGYLGEKGASAAKKGRQVKQLEKEIPTKSKLSDLNKYSLEP